MSAPVAMFGYLRPHSSLKPHQVAGASDKDVAEAVIWTTNDWRDDPEWVCVATGEMTLQRRAPGAFVAQMVDNLREQQRALRANAESAAVELERQINSLLSITHDGSATEVA